MFDDLDRLIHSDPFAKTTSHPVLHLKEGERREVCILFADCHGFTALSERLDHEIVHNLVDKLMQLFTARIKHFGGFIDKYEGDMVMALFGAKVASEQDTERAIEAGLQMLSVLDQFNHLVSQRLGLDVSIAVRLGINTGEVTTGRVGEKREGDFTVYGDAVNLASRMESNAPLNRIMLPEATMRRVIHAFDFEIHSSIFVKGKTEPVDAWLVVGPKAERLSRWQLRWNAFVGRESEMRLLRQRYEQVVRRIETHANDPAEKTIIIGLKGEAGIGKSRLVDEFLRQEGAHLSALYGTTSRLVQQAYSQFFTMIRRKLGISALDSIALAREKLQSGLEELRQFAREPDLSEHLRDAEPLLGYLLGLEYDDARFALPPSEIQPHIQTAIKLFIGVCAAKENQSGLPLVVVLEDWHLADDLSLVTLDFLLFTLNLEEQRRQADTRHIIFILTYRPGYAPSRGIYADAQFEEIDLAELTTDSARALAASIAAGASISDETMTLLMEKSQGNPFYIEEWATLIAESPKLVKDMQLPAPGTLQALIQARLDQLDVEVKQILQRAAVLGREFLVQVLRVMEQKLEQSIDFADKLSLLEARSLITPLPGKRFTAYLFKHVLTRDVTYNTLLLTNRKALHKIAAEAIEEMFAYRLEEYFLDLADHYYKGEVWSKAVEYLPRAATQAKGKYNNQSALQLFDRLLQLQSSHPDLVSPQTRINALLEKVDILVLTGKWQDARELAEQTLKVAEELGDIKLIARTLSTVGWSTYLAGDHEAALACYEKSLLLARAEGDSLGAATALNNMGLVLRGKGNYSKAMEYHRESLRMAEEIKDKKLISLACGNIGIIHNFQGDINGAIEWCRRQFSIAEELMDRRIVSIAVGNMGNLYYMQNENDQALECYQKQLAIAEDLGDKKMISLARGNMGMVLKRRGDFEQALDCYQKKLSMAEELGDKVGISAAIGNMGNLFGESGDYEKSMECLHKQLSIVVELGDRRGVSTTQGNMGYLFALQGDFERALECYRQQLSIAEERDDKRIISLALGEMGQVFLEQGDYSRAGDHLERAISLLRELKNKDADYIGFLLSLGAVNLQKMELSQSRENCAEALQSAQKLKLKELIVEAELLAVKIELSADNTVAGSAAAIDFLVSLLQRAEKDEHRAFIHSELATVHRGQSHIDQAEFHRVEARKLFESLFAKAPKFAYRKQLEGLRQIGSGIHLASTAALLQPSFNKEHLPKGIFG